VTKHWLEKVGIRFRKIPTACMAWFDICDDTHRCLAVFMNLHAGTGYAAVG